MFTATKIDRGAAAISKISGIVVQGTAAVQAAITKLDIGQTASGGAAATTDMDSDEEPLQVIWLIGEYARKVLHKVGCQSVLVIILECMCAVILLRGLPRACTIFIPNLIHILYRHSIAQSPSQFLTLHNTAPEIGCS